MLAPFAFRDRPWTLRKQPIIVNRIYDVAKHWWGMRLVESGYSGSAQKPREHCHLKTARLCRQHPVDCAEEAAFCLLSSAVTLPLLSAVLYCDVDMVFVKNPLPLLHSAPYDVQVCGTSTCRTNSFAGHFY